MVLTKICGFRQKSICDKKILNKELVETNKLNGNIFFSFIDFFIYSFMH